MQLTPRFVKTALERYAVWNLGNEALYELCRKHPEHRDDDAILAKVWLIGRSYAASIERRRRKPSENGDEFYLDRVAPAIKRAGVDRWFEPLRVLRRPNPAAVIPVHKRLTELFEHISGLEKRSLASKYLHFHFPRAVYIFDDRVSRGIRRVTPALRLRALPFNPCDDPYARFFLRCAQFHEEIEQLMERRLSPREVDTVLLAVADRE
jgi:hypothetical protein